jgi:hypothetical protein
LVAESWLSISIACQKNLIANAWVEWEWRTVPVHHTTGPPMGFRLFRLSPEPIFLRGPVGFDLRLKGLRCCGRQVRN